MAVAMAAPLAVAGDRCDRRSYGRDDRASYQGSYYSGYRDNGYRSTYGYNDNYSYRDNGYYGRERSAGKSAAIVGGSAVAGAVIGGLTGGGKGAAVGAVVGGIGGVVVDQATRNNNRYGSSYGYGSSYRRR